MSPAAPAGCVRSRGHQDRWVRNQRLVEDALAHGLLADELRECDWGKMIAVGNTVAASVTASSGRGVLFANVERGAIPTSATLPKALQIQREPLAFGRP
jgi:hypothetical protein